MKKIFVVLISLLILAGVVTAGIIDFLNPPEEKPFVNVTRTLQTDTICNDGKCVVNGYLNAVNYYYNNEFIPFEDYLNVSNDNGKIKLETLDHKICYFELIYEKEDVLSISNHQINISKYRGGHHFTTDVGVDVNSMNYKINCEGVLIKFEDDKFWMDDIYVDFNQAKDEQNISTFYNEKDKVLEFTIIDGKTGNLRMIDPDTGATSPGTAADDAAVGTLTWTNVDNIKLNDADPASVGTTFSSPLTSHYLKATNFGFTIPEGATIDGIFVEIEERDGGSTGDITDNEVKIVKSDGSIGTENKAKVPAWTAVTTYTEYGAVDDLWSETWAYTDINDADFGVVLSAILDGGYRTAQVDHIQITVYYTEGAPEDSCTCTSGSNWEINMSDYCVLSTPCSPNAVTYISTGNFTCNSVLNASSFGDLDSGQRRYITSNCREIDR